LRPKLPQRARPARSTTSSTTASETTPGVDGGMLPYKPITIMRICVKKVASAGASPSRGHELTGSVFPSRSYGEPGSRRVPPDFFSRAVPPSTSRFPMCISSSDRVTEPGC
jgi:hypothetical protein